MKDCLHTEDTTQWLAGFRRRARQSRIPITAMLELTRLCNLRCLHCYLGDPQDQNHKRPKEHDTEAVKASIREWREAGCLHLVITGGDPMMRPDFRDIYKYACEQGMLVTVFCDGILVDDRILACFAKYPPRSVEITVYGATAGTYDSVTRVPGSYALAWKGINRLLVHGHRVFLKTVLLSINRHELSSMKAQAAALDCRFRYDAAIFPCLPGGSTDPLALRVPPEEVVSAELEDEALVEGFRKAIRHFETAPESETLYQCGAGQTAFYADPYGTLSPCLLATPYRYQQNGRPFRDVWNKDLGQIQHRKRKKQGSVVASGGLRGACTHCPAINYLETGDEETDSPYMEKTTRLRYAAMMKRGI